MYDLPPSDLEKLQAELALKQQYGKPPPFAQTKEGVILKGQQALEAAKIKAGSKAPTLKPMLNASNQWTYHEWKDGDWVDTGKVAKEPKKKDDLKQVYFQQIGRYYSAKRGVGQFIQDPNKELVAKDALRAAEIIAIQYVKNGG